MTDPRLGATTVDLAGSIAGRFALSALMRQILVGAAAYALVVLLAPWMLMLESLPLAELWLATAGAGCVGTLVSAALSVNTLRKCRSVLEALAFYPERIEPEQLHTLTELPFSLTARLFAGSVAAAVLLLVPALRPPHIDDARALSLGLLVVIIVGAASVLCYVAVREVTLRALELGPTEPIAAWLEQDAIRFAPRRRTVQKILLAVVLPVAFVGGGALLVAHAHLRSFVEESRTTTAVRVARIALESLRKNSGREGREEAVAAAQAHGFAVRFEDAPSEPARPAEPAEPATSLLPNGQLELAIPLTTTDGAFDGTARVRFLAELSSSLALPLSLIVAGAVALAALLGYAFGRALASDLVLASRRVQSLGTDASQWSDAPFVDASRFAVVSDLDASVAALAARFAEFASAQRRALRARASAQRGKHLLFASVSHDLKSPLNAVLGFSELVRLEPLSQAQLESLEIVASRGRELLALIETILDAARVEAGQLKLEKELVPATALVGAALEKARDLVGDRGADVVIELARDMPPISADRVRGSLALAALLAHAMGSLGKGSGRAVRVRGARSDSRGMAGIHIEHADSHGQHTLLERQLSGRSPTSRDRGLVLRLSLARAVIELHGGRVEVTRGPRGEPVVTCFWPTSDGVSGSRRT